ncbi:MAG: hypothetical protein H7144_16450 [Burkholderiales bacterium]|nr:hypothetical protein [Phycisphaerae bacterium]
MINLLSQAEASEPAVQYPWIIPAAIVLLGVFVYGFRDVLRFSFGRVWAIGGVCFRDAIRRKVLWITPLAMVGVVIVSQLQKPIDGPDAIRQTIKFCFFATAIVVTVIALITAATNLPREIENRVIFTIVTKPVTRLEITLGKIIGFSRVSAAMLIIMGLFTVGYLHLRSWSWERSIALELESPSLNASDRGWLEHFHEQGLLQARTITRAGRLMQYAKLPEGNTGRWMQGGSQDSMIPFRVEPGNLAQAANPAAAAGAEKAYFIFNIPYEALPGGERPGDAAATAPEVQIQIIDSRSDRVLVSGEQLAMKGTQKPDELQNIRPASAALNGFARIEIPRAVGQQLEQAGSFYVQLMGQPNYLYRVEKDAVQIAVGNLDDPDPAKAQIIGGVPPANEPIIRGGLSNTGQQLRGPERGVEPVAIYSFKNTPIPQSINGQVPFELKIVIDRTDDSESDDPTLLAMQVKDLKSQKISPQTLVYPENRRTTFFSLPAEYLQSGEFEILVRNRNSGQTISLNESALLLIADRQPFAWNLFKGLFILWLFSLLVAIVAFFCSTFLSWPIAVVLSILIVLGKWTVLNLDIGTGIGAQFAQEYFPTNTAAATVVNQSVEALTRGLTLVTAVLPDIGPFGVTEQIERGGTISIQQVREPLKILLVFGLPVTALAYVLLRNKEVAP